jgi:peptidoglycan/LPS O-acetylase OafA/YrhL
MASINTTRPDGTETTVPANAVKPTLKHRSPSYIPCLDGIRAMAAVMVMVFHFVGHHGEPARLVQASVIGQTGVDLFFVLSGFLITRILLLSRESPHFFSAFYARRALRIFPLYYAFLAVYFFVLPMLYKESIPPYSTQVWSWFYLQNIPATFVSLKSSGPSHFWSLAVEEHFYFVWPLMVFLLSRRQFKCLLIATLLVPPLLRLAFISHGVGVFYFTLTRMDSIGYGAVLAVLFTEEAFRKRGVILLLRFLLVGLPLVLLPAFARLSGSQNIWLEVIKLSLIPAFYFSLIGFCIMDPASKWLSRIFSTPLLRWLGRISYGLYVFHPTCADLVQRWLKPSSALVNLAACFGLTILIAYLSFRYFESPLTKLKERFGYDISVKNPTVQPQENATRG